MSEIKYCLIRTTHGSNWQCICPLTNIDTGELHHWYLLVEKCIKILLDEGINPPPNLNELVADAYCKQRPNSLNCAMCDPKKQRQKVNIGSVAQWVKAMYNWGKKERFKLVDQELAEQRAEICSSCPEQVEVSGCWGCRGVANLLPMIAGARTTKSDLKLKACGRCGCYNKASVHLPIDPSHESNIEYPDHCWKAKELVALSTDNTVSDNL